MGDIKLSTKNPPPKGYRRFENAYILAFAPAIMGAIQSWGLSDHNANRGMILITLSVAFVKGIGMIISNGEVYAQADTITVEKTQTNTTTVVDATDTTKQ